jgi:rod shape-determining protein MreC
MNRDSRRTRIVLTLLVLISITLITIDYRDGRGGVLGRAGSAASNVFGPVERAVSDAVDPVGRFFASVGHLSSYRSQVATLTRANQQLRSELDQASLSRSQEQQLRSLVGLSGADELKVVPASVVALGGSLGFDYVATLDVGRATGIAVGDTVVSGQGLVGDVSSVGPLTSQITLAIDPGKVVGARLLGDLQVGEVTGGGLGDMTFEAYSPREQPRAGQLLVTVGSTAGSIYAPGIPIGRVVSVSEDAGGTSTAQVSPAVGFTSLDVVGVVIAGPKSGTSGAILGPRPRVTITVTVTRRPSPSPTGTGTTRAPGSAPTPTPTPSG